MRININETDLDLFNASNEGKKTNYYLKRVKIVGILCIAIGLIWLVLSFYYQLKWYEYVSSIILIIFGIYFIINSKRIKNKEVNKYLYKQKNIK